MTESVTLDIHAEHWKEPSVITEARPDEEKFCDVCGEDVPWHNASCGMLKNAYKRRWATCSFCPEKHLVGDNMREHVVGNHEAEFAAVYSTAKRKKK